MANVNLLLNCFRALVVLLATTTGIHAQYLVVGNGNSGGNEIPFQSTVLTSFDYSSASCSSFDYFFDLDQDSINDVIFNLNCYMGGMGSFYKVGITTFNDFSIHMDTAYIEHYQFINSLGEVQDTTRKTPAVKKYEIDDTIFSNQNYLSTSGRILNYYDGHFPICFYNNVNPFLGDTAYIAFEKSNGDLYYFEIYQMNKSQLELLKLKTSAPVFNYTGNGIYPNPALSKIHFNNTYEFIEIYSAEGTLVMPRSVILEQTSFDVSNLRSGLYFVVLEKDNQPFTTKLLKL